jgi:hypothetical protein
MLQVLGGAEGTKVLEGAAEREQRAEGRVDSVRRYGTP